MKVIITGSTGSVGSAVLQACIQNPSITSIVALTRRPIDINDPKLANIIHKDFLTYHAEVVDQLKGAQACIWALSSPTSGKEVHIDYTWAAINMCKDKLMPALKEGQKFRFVYTSGGAVPYLESNALFFLGAWRKMRAQLDREILEVETKNSETWESFVCRPWFVVDEPPPVKTAILGDNCYILRPELGAAMVDMALNGNQERMVPNAELRTIGQAAMKRLKL